ncbi:MAG: hypothetical protein HPY66_3185 [Firmicutes bacterium]|nr:hypothetical protein [Bacillota bacterium]
MLYFKYLSSLDISKGRKLKHYFKNRQTVLFLLLFKPNKRDNRIAVEYMFV